MSSESQEAKPKTAPKTRFSLKNHWFFKISPETREELLKFFKDMLGIIRGKADVKSRLMLLADPPNYLTSVRLTPQQVRFVAGAEFDAMSFPIFEGLGEFAKTFALTTVSKGGLGREDQIRFVQALQEARTLSRAVRLQEVGKDVET